MKTIEELCNNAYNGFIAEIPKAGDHLVKNICSLSFCSGWDAAVNELTRWRDPYKELPESGAAALVKLSSGDIYATRYAFGLGWVIINSTKVIPDDKIARWRYIRLL